MIKSLLKAYNLGTLMYYSKIINEESFLAWNIAELSLNELV